MCFFFSLLCYLLAEGSGYVLGVSYVKDEMASGERNLCVCVCVSAGWHVKVTSVTGVPVVRGHVSPPAASDGSLTDLWSGFIILIYDEPARPFLQPGCRCVVSLSLQLLLTDVVWRATKTCMYAWSGGKWTQGCVKIVAQMEIWKEWQAFESRHFVHLAVVTAARLLWCSSTLWMPRALFKSCYRISIGFESGLYCALTHEDKF